MNTDISKKKFLVWKVIARELPFLQNNLNWTFSKNFILLIVLLVLFQNRSRQRTFLKNQSNSDQRKLIVNSVSQPPFNPLFVCLSIHFQTTLPLLGFLGFTSFTDFWNASYLNNNSYYCVHTLTFLLKFAVVKHNLKRCWFEHCAVRTLIEFRTIHYLISKFWNSVNWSITGS